SGQTNTSLVLSNVQTSANGSTYYLQVANAYGTNDSATVTLTVYSGAQIYSQPPAQVFVPGGGTASIPVTAFGAPPLFYQWQLNGANLTDNGRITGSLSNVLTITDAQLGNAGSYQVIVTNASGSVTSSVATLLVGEPPVTFNTNGSGWT